MARLFERLAELETAPKLDWLKVEAAPRASTRPRASAGKQRLGRARRA
jgi:hypothetical protein